MVGDPLKEFWHRRVDHIAKRNLHPAPNGDVGLSGPFDNFG
jgi:hypothetical protein